MGSKMPDFLQFQWVQIIEFGAGCGLMGFLVFLVDAISFKVGHSTSLLRITYRERNGFILLVLWTAGAALVGGIGTYIGIVQFTKSAVLAVGVGWPVLLSKIVQSNHEQSGPALSADTESEA